MGIQWNQGRQKGLNLLQMRTKMSENSIEGFQRGVYALHGFGISTYLKALHVRLAREQLMILATMVMSVGCSCVALPMPGKQVQVKHNLLVQLHISGCELRNGTILKK